MDSVAQAASIVCEPLPAVEADVRQFEITRTLIDKALYWKMHWARVLRPSVHTMTSFSIMSSYVWQALLEEEKHTQSVSLS